MVDKSMVHLTIKHNDSSLEICIFFFSSRNLAPEINVLMGVSISTASLNLNFFICFIDSENHQWHSGFTLAENNEELKSSFPSSVTLNKSPGSCSFIYDVGESSLIISSFYLNGD
ncbi:hypothetical protein QTP88_019357 [Uroleucon formosanum]